MIIVDKTLNEKLKFLDSLIDHSVNVISFLCIHN